MKLKLVGLLLFATTLRADPVCCYTAGPVPTCLPSPSNTKTGQWMNEPAIVWQWCFNASRNSFDWWVGTVAPAVVNANQSTKILSQWQAFWATKVGAPGLHFVETTILVNLWLPHLVNGKAINPPPAGWPP